MTNEQEKAVQVVRDALAYEEDWSYERPSIPSGGNRSGSVAQGRYGRT